MTDDDSRLSSTFGRQADSGLCVRGGESKFNLPELQKGACTLEGHVSPVRPLRRKESLPPQCKENCDGSSHTIKDSVDDFLEIALRSSGFPVPRPRTKKHPSGLFVDDGFNLDVPAACFPINKETDQKDGQLILPVPLPRAKKRLLASTCNEYGTLDDPSRKVTTTLPLGSNKTSEDRTSPNSSAIGGDQATIQFGGDDSSELEGEVCPPTAEEEFLHSHPEEDQEKAKDEMEGWTFPDQHGVIDHFEQDAISGLPRIKTVRKADVDESGIGDDWLYVANDKDDELHSTNDVRTEEVDFGFVSVHLAQR